MMQQIQQAMADPESQAAMMQFAEQMQQAVQSNPQLAQLTKSLEGMDMEGGLQAAMEQLQNNPMIKQMAEQMQAGGGGADKMREAMQQSQQMIQQLMSDPDAMKQAMEQMAAAMQPDKINEMAEQMAAIMGGGGMPGLRGGGGMAGLRGGSNDVDNDGLGSLNWDKDEM